MIEITENSKDCLVLKFTNGDIELLKKAQQRFEFSSFEETLRFAMSVLAVSEGKILKVKQNDSFVSVSPVRKNKDKEVEKNGE